MSRPRSPLPSYPHSLALPRTTASLRSAGVSRTEIAGPLWTPVFRGVHRWVLAGPLTAIDRIQAVIALLPRDAAIGGWAALHWLGVAELDGRTGPAAQYQFPVQVCLGPVGRIRHRLGLDIDRSTILPQDLTLHDGITVTSAARSCLDVARRLGAEEGLVAADAALRAGVTTSIELADALGRMAGLKGVPAARLVAGLADPRAESAPESRLRFVWVVEAGLPVPMVNPVVLDRAGGFRGRADLVDDEAGLVGEYDGAGHRELDRHTADNVREEGFESLNLTVARATAIDLWPQRPRLVQRLAERRAQGLARNRQQDRWVLRAS